MSAKDRLQIILITYNRAKFVKQTFDRFFYEGSPVYDYDFLVLDNNSSDNTAEVVAEFAKTHPNIKYSKNRYNLGISGNIAKAMEIAEKDYVWIIGDDDKFDFSNWGEVEQAISNNEEIIIVSRYGIPDGCENNIPMQVGMLTFITGGIYKTSLYNDTTMRNTFDNIFTLFPHLVPVMQAINDNKKMYVVRKAISANGMDEEEKDCSYVRGYQNENLCLRTRTMNWWIGYANICQMIKDKDLAYKVFLNGVNGICGSEENLVRDIETYFSKDLLMQVVDVYQALPKSSVAAKGIKKVILRKYFPNYLFRKTSTPETRNIKLFNGLIDLTFKKRKKK